MTKEENGPVVRVPASSANLGSGFDVLGMALNLCADFGTGDAPQNALQLDEFHPANIAFVLSGGEGPLWMSGSIPMARGLGFSGAARVGGAALAVVQGSDRPQVALRNGVQRILRISSELEGHGDNVVASLFGGVAALVDGTTVSLRLGPVISNATVVAWIPEVTTSTDSSRAGLPRMIDRADAVHNLGRVVQFVVAIEHDDPTMLLGATSDRLHQSSRFEHMPGAAEALAAGVEAGAWCGWHCCAMVQMSRPWSGRCQMMAIASNLELTPLAPESPNHLTRWGLHAKRGVPISRTNVREVSCQVCLSSSKSSPDTCVVRSSLRSLSPKRRTSEGSRFRIQANSEHNSRVRVSRQDHLGVYAGQLKLTMSFEFASRWECCPNWLTRSARCGCNVRRIGKRTSLSLSRNERHPNTMLILTPR